ncbi:MAG: hypothetical protein QM500_10340 [Methylococcales bacterium]
MKKANEKFEASRFSCIYGRALRKPLREIASIMEVKSVVTRRELRAIIAGGFFRNKRNAGGGEATEKIVLLKSKLLFFADTYLLTMLLFLLALYLMPLFSVADMTREVVLIYFVAIPAVLFIAFYHYQTAIKSFFIVDRIFNDFNREVVNMKNPKVVALNR